MKHTKTRLKTEFNLLLRLVNLNIYNLDLEQIDLNRFDYYFKSLKRQILNIPMETPEKSTEMCSAT